MSKPKMIEAKRKPTFGHLYLPTYPGSDGTLKQSSKWWWIYPGFNNGKPANTKHKTEEGAHIQIAEWLRDMRIGEYDSVPQRIRWSDAEALLIRRWKVDRSEGMLEEAPRILRRLRDVFGSFPLASITTAKVEDYILARRDEGAADGQIRFEMKVLRRGFTVAKVPPPDFPRYPKATPRRGLILPEQWDAILVCVDDHYIPVLSFLDLTGWRLSEGLGLTWDRTQVGPEGATIKLYTSKSRKPRERGVAKNSQLYRLLADRNAKRQDGVPWVFTSMKTPTLPIASSTMTCIWRKACVEAKVMHKDGSPLLIHDIRRTWIVRADRAGVSDTLKMAAVGHEVIQQMREYRILENDEIAEALVLAERPMKLKIVKRKTA